MKNIEILQMNDIINNNINKLSILKGKKISIVILNNLKLIKSEVEKINSYTQPSEDFLEYENKRIDLCNNFTKKNEDGTIVEKLNNNGQQEFDINVEDPLWINAISELKSEYTNTLNNREEQIKKYNDVLNTESDIVFEKLEISDLPDDISLEVLSILQFFINM